MPFDDCGFIFHVRYAPNLFTGRKIPFQVNQRQVRSLQSRKPNVLMFFSFETFILLPGLVRAIFDNRAIGGNIARRFC
jgi:hypothetical protein